MKSMHQAGSGICDHGYVEDALSPGLNTPVEEVPHLREQVYGRIRRAIINGDLKPGERLSTSELAQSLGVSTMPVREAIRLLEDDGLVETSARRWTRVATVSAEEADELYPLVGLLEEFAVAAAGPPTVSQIERLREANDRLEQAAAMADPLACINADEEFHTTLLERCPNHAALRTIAQYKARMRLLEGAFFRDGPRASVEQHAGIIAAAAQGDFQLAGGLVRANWAYGHEAVRGSLIEDRSSS
jgi:DNA-binding GntR family transcriptional regulator